MKKRKIHKDKRGCEYIKESYFLGGKMKFRRIYVVDGIPAEEFYEKNATDLDHFINGEYWLISSEQVSNESIDYELNPDEKETKHYCIKKNNQQYPNDNCEVSNKPEPDEPDDKIEDLPF